MKNKIMFVLMLAICLLVMPNVYAEEELKLSVKAGTSQAYGKQASDLGDISVTDGKVTGTLKYVDGYTGFSSHNDEQKGYFLFLELGDRTSDATYKFQLKGEGTKATGPVELKTGDNLIVAKLNNNKQTIEVTAEKSGQTKKLTYNLDEIKFDKLSATVTIPEADTSTGLGEKKASDLQSNVKFNATTGFSGTLNYLENFDEFAEGIDGYFLFFQVNGGDKTTVYAALTGEGADHPDAYVTDENGLFVFKINNNNENIKVKVVGENGEYLEETYSLAKLSLGKEKESEEIVEAEADEETTNPSTSDSLLIYVSLGVIALVTALGTGLYLKRN